MENQLINICNFTPEIYCEYYNKHIFKKAKIATFICSLLLIFNLISLIRLNIFGYDNILAILVVSVTLIISLLIHLFLPNFIAVYNYTKRENLGKEYLTNKTVFYKNHFEVISSDISTTEYYNQIKKIKEFENITVLVMKNKKINYIIDNKNFKNGNLDTLKTLIKEDV